jgi:pyridoxine 5'-phosphate synthase PdxJ
VPKDVSDEIDTIIEASEGKSATNIAERLMGQSTGISLFGEAASTKVEPSAAAALPEIKLYFGAFPRAVYCNVDELKLRLIQTGEGKGIAYSTFTQTCGSRRSDVAHGADWSFDVDLYTNAFVRNISSAHGRIAAASISSS